MPTIPLNASSPTTLPALAALPSVSLRRHGLYLAAISAYFRATGAIKRPQLVPISVATTALPPLRSA